MPLIKLIRHGQVTLPTKFREALSLEEGDYLEAEMKGNAIVLKPKVVSHRDKAISELHELMNEVQARNEAYSAEEVEQEVLKVIQAVRRQKRHAQSRS